jgi:hypothetical protein
MDEQQHEYLKVPEVLRTLIARIPDDSDPSQQIRYIVLFRL